MHKSLASGGAFQGFLANRRRKKDDDDKSCLSLSLSWRAANPIRTNIADVMLRFITQLTMPWTPLLLLHFMFTFRWSGDDCLKWNHPLGDVKKRENYWTRGALSSLCIQSISSSSTGQGILSRASPPPAVPYIPHVLRITPAADVVQEDPIHNHVLLHQRCHLLLPP